MSTFTRPAVGFPADFRVGKVEDFDGPSFGRKAHAELRDLLRPAAELFPSD